MKKSNFIKTALILLSLLFLAACSTPSMPTAARATSTRTIKAPPQSDPGTLKIGIRIFREAYSKWPRTIEELASRTDYGIDFDSYENPLFTIDSSTQLTATFGPSGSRTTITVVYDPSKVSAESKRNYSKPNFMIRLRKR